MRYHKAISLTKAEASFLKDVPTPTMCDCIVVESLGRWYDVRHMNTRELNAFLDDLERSHFNGATAGFVTLH